ncbi:MAG TPA: hypothetical protein VL088_15025, partial [Pedobacter sp.]|nr:hypothetical protein [Pedobacter sp.]
FNQIKTGVDSNSSTKQLLEKNFEIINKILKGEKIWGYLFLPLSGPSGLIVYKLTIDNNFGNLINSSNFVLLLCLLTLVGLLFIFIAQKINNGLFTKQIKDLQEKIDQLAD